MIKSMTGYGRELCSFEDRDILVEIRSVNHRYYEFSAKVPRAYGYLEAKLKEFLNGKIARGKVEVSVSVYNKEGRDVAVAVNKGVAGAYINALREANEELGLTDDITLSRIFGLPDVFIVNKEIEDEEIIWAEVSKTAEAALQRFLEMREREGEALRSNLLEKLDYIESIVKKIEEREPSVTEAYRKRLYDKISEVVGDSNIDEQRILTEAAIFAEKTAVDEETVRLKSHIAQFREILGSREPIGRKLDFLMQEMNREANTTGSKAADLETTDMVVTIKSELEKIREQIQNIE